MENTPESATMRCLDFGTSMSAEIKHTECRHCRKCMRPALCGYNHDQWSER